MNANGKDRESGQVNASWVNSFCITILLVSRVMAVYRARYANCVNKCITVYQCPQ